MGYKIGQRIGLGKCADATNPVHLCTHYLAKVVLIGNICK